VSSLSELERSALADYLNALQKVQGQRARANKRSVGQVS
jgi:hypothetical protein